MGIQKDNVTSDTVSNEVNAEIKKGPVRQVIETILYFASYCQLFLL